MSDTELPDKLFFKIGEVAQIVGVKAHVLRYWESEFSGLRPMKTRGAHRMYRRRDVELAVVLRRMLHEERLTVAGAKKRLREAGRGRTQDPPDPSATRELADRATLIALRKQLGELLGVLERTGLDAADTAAGATVTVTSALPGAAPVRGLKTVNQRAIGTCPTQEKV